MQSERVEEIVSDVRQALRGRQIGYTGLGRLRDGVTVTIRDASDVELAREVLAGLAQPVVANVFGGFNQAVDLDVKAVEEQTFHLLITEEATLARNTSTCSNQLKLFDDALMNWARPSRPFSVRVQPYSGSGAGLG